MCRGKGGQERSFSVDGRRKQDADRDRSAPLLWTGGGNKTLTAGADLSQQCSRAASRLLPPPLLPPQEKKPTCSSPLGFLSLPAVNLWCPLPVVCPHRDADPAGPGGGRASAWGQLWKQRQLRVVAGVRVRRRESAEWRGR